MNSQNGDGKLKKSGARAARIFSVLASGRTRARSRIRAFATNERGASAIEYCFIAFLISIIAIVAMTQIGVLTLANMQSVVSAFSR
jgi:Flp pilus assembly pilin Flp